MSRAERFAAIHAACFTGDPAPWPAPIFAQMLAEPSIFACEAPDALLLGRVVLDEAELLTLAVAPPARRRGHARRLLAEFEAMAQTRGACQAFLEVAETNPAARTLYALAGWKPVGRRPNYYGPTAALILKKTLQAGLIQPER